MGIEKVTILLGELRYPNETPIPEPVSAISDPSKRIKKSLVSKVTTSGAIVEGTVTNGSTNAALGS